jgi:DNA-binding transcriptional LysR family regulator
MSINLNTFRVFLSVYEQKSMSGAANQLHLTQSGISQHIRALRALEHDLGFPLFERVNKKLFPTHNASLLYGRGKRGLHEIEQAVREVSKGPEVAEGLVRVGLPVEFGNTVVIPGLARIGRRHPGINYEITLDFATALSRMVVRGELDFALIDRFRVDSSLRVEPVAHETLILCGLKSYVQCFGPVKANTAYFSQLDYVEYTEGEPILRSWFRHHLLRQNIPLRVRARVFDVQGVARFICEGLGVGVLPHLVVERLQREGVELYVFESKRAPLKNEISMISLPLKDRPLAQRLVMDAVRLQAWPDILGKQGS